MPILHRSRLALAVAGLGLAITGPVQAAEFAQPSRWTLNVAPPPALPQVAVLPPLPAAPRVYALTPERRALLNTIRWAEGTWANGDDIGYRVMFGGSLMPSLERHPDRVMYSTRYASAAAGAYQFMPFTWRLASQALGLTGFHPEAQDQAAIYLVHRRGALQLADRGEMTPELAALLSREWASFPTLTGSSFYGQPVKRFEDLRAFYEWNLRQLRASQSQEPQWETVAIRRVAPSCNPQSLSCQLKRVGSSATTSD